MLFAAMAGELKLPSVGTKAMVEALMKQVLVLVLRRGAALHGGELSLRLLLADPRIGRVVATIVAHPGHPHSVDTLAAAAGMSRSCFNRQFAVAYEGTPMDFVQGVRLREAARMLTASNLPVKSVAAAVGFTSRSHFSRAFTLKFGLDPSRYRSLPADQDSASAQSNGPSFPSGI
jgi:transcriptional regulator GlxA family with amidase domain